MSDERPVPDPSRPPLEGPMPSRGKDRDGMTWTALVVLILCIVLIGLRLWVFWDDRHPSGVQTQEATVVGYGGLDNRRPGSSGPDNDSIVFELADGEQASALYQRRWFGKADAGDTITVYQDDGRWRTTSETSLVRILLWVGSLFLFLLMTYGWFRVRLSRRRSPA